MLKCRECGAQKQEEYFITPTLCRNCDSRKHRGPTDNPLLKYGDGIVLTHRVDKKLWRLAQKQIPEIPRTWREVLATAIFPCCFILFWLVGYPIAHPNPIADSFLLGMLWLWGAVAWYIGLPSLIAGFASRSLTAPRDALVRARWNDVRLKWKELAQERKRRTEEREAFYSSPEWAFIRDIIIQEHGRVCHRCGKKIKKDVDLTVDHIKPRSKFPDLALDKSNLRVLCRQCNSRKGAREPKETHA